ncbi:MAG: hypothetical protein ACYTFG_10030 [Planctomycetota bacterium]|jgi:nitrate reductase cytochrome c-type subunit
MNLPDVVKNTLLWAGILSIFLVGCTTSARDGDPQAPPPLGKSVDLARPGPLRKPVENSGGQEGLILDDGATRESRRAFHTAPPVIPHRLGRGDHECLTCHETPRSFRGRRSTPSPHPEFKNCAQCHLKITPYFDDWRPREVENEFEGSEGGRKGERSHIEAPPTIPHRTFLREKCNTCHAGNHPFQSLKGPHPERANCMQCHVVARGDDF